MKRQNNCNILFKGFEGLSIKKILMILDETYEGYYSGISFYIHLKKYFNSRWYDRYEYKCSRFQNNKFIAFYSDLYYRKDHLTIFNNFIKEFPEFDFVVPVRLPKDRRNFLRGFRMMRWDINSLWRLRKVKMQFKKRIFCIRVLGLVCWFYPQMERILNSNAYSYGLVYNDSNPYENILVQLMKQKGMHTATLQHGIFDKHGYWKGLEFRTSVADDWLAWNPYTKELAMECGIPVEKIKVLGIPRYIHPIAIEKREKLGVFSVILGGKVLADENQKLIKFANILSEEQGLKYFLRYHPNCENNEYEHYANKLFCISRDSQGEPVSRMCEESDFSLVGSGTSMIIDLMYLKQPFLQYYQGWDGEEYKGRKNYFRSYEELKELLHNDNTLQNEEMFCYYCTTLNVKQSYAHYFNSMSKKF